MNSILLNEKLHIKENITAIEILFKDIKEAASDKIIYNKLEEIKELIYDEFNISVMDMYQVNTVNSIFFGMRIFPSREELDEITMKIVSTEDGFIFENCNDIIIEIDDKLIEDFDSRQLTAVLLHEIGHKAENSKLLSDIDNVVTRNISAMSKPMRDVDNNINDYNDMGRRAIFSKVTIATLFSTPSVLLQGKNKKEFRADSFAVKYGYGQALSEVVLKLNAYKQPTAVDEKDKGSFIQYMLDIGDTFLQRRRKILRLLKDELANSNSPYERDLLKTQIKNLER